MKGSTMYVITGATSNSGGAVARALLAQGASVRVIGRSLDRLQPLLDRGAHAFVADPSDPAAMLEAFDGASAAWIMLQPNYIADSSDFRAYQDGLIGGIAGALRRSSVRHVQRYRCGRRHRAHHDVDQLRAIHRRGMAVGDENRDGAMIDTR